MGISKSDSQTAKSRVLFEREAQTRRKSLFDNDRHYARL